MQVFLEERGAFPSAMPVEDRQVRYCCGILPDFQILNRRKRILHALPLSYIRDDPCVESLYDEL